MQFKQRAIETWRINGQALISDAGSEAVAPIASDVSPETAAPEEADWSTLEEFNWLSPELLKAEVLLGGQPTLIYAELPPLPPPTGNGKQPPPKKWPVGPLGMALQPGIKVAAIDKASMLPKALQQGDLISTYTFGSPSQATLEIPPKIKMYLDPDAK